MAKAKTKLAGSVFQRDGKYWAMVEMDSGEAQDPERPSTFGYTQDVGPFDTEKEAQDLLDTGTIKGAVRIKS